MLGGSLHLAVFGSGIIFNILLLVRCFMKDRWRLLGPIKYFIVVQAVLATSCISSHSAIIIAAVRGHHGALWCRVLPTIIIVFVSAAVFNMTALVIIKQMQVMRNVKVTPRTVRLALVGVFGCTALVLSPALVNPIGSGAPVFECEGCQCKNEPVLEEDEVFPVDINVYASWFLIIQFIVPVAIIVNRLCILAVYCAFKELAAEKEISAKHARSWYSAIHTMTIVSVTLAAFAVFARHRNPRNDAMNSLNTLFHVMELFFVVVLCFPVYLLDLMALEVEDALVYKEQDKKVYVELNEKSDATLMEIIQENEPTSDLVLKV